MSDTPSVDKAEPVRESDNGPVRSFVPIGFERGIAAIAMGAIFLISITNTVVRYITNSSFAFTEEYSIFLVVVMTFAGTATAFALHRNIAVTFIRDMMPRLVGLIFDNLNMLASITMFGLVAYYGGMLAYEEWLYEETSAGLGNPAWIYTIWMPVLSLVVIARIVERWFVQRKRSRTTPDKKLDGGL